MSFGNASTRRRDGTNQQDRREITKGTKRQSCAILQDGTIIPVMDLAHQVDLAMHGNVKRFAWADEILPEMFYNPDVDADIWNRISSAGVN